MIFKKEDYGLIDYMCMGTLFLCSVAILLITIVLILGIIG